MDRATKFSFLLMTCPLLACSDDLPTVPGGTSTGGESTTDPATTIDPTNDPDSSTSATSTTVDPSSGSDSTGSTTMEETTGDTSSSSSDGSSSEGSSSTTNGDTCGDGALDAGEDCDGAELGGATCDSIGMGFTDGTLTCADDCTYDTSGCSTCGNDLVEGAEECDGPDLAGSVCADLGMGFTGGTLACDASCAYDTAACTNVPWPVGGEVIITEIMQNPMALLDGDGEWFELYNPMMGVTYQLGSCVVEGNMSDAGFTITTDLEIGPQEYRIFATDSMMDQGFIADFQWDDMEFSLNNSNDEVRLVCNGVMVDEVIYDNGATFPDPNGQSMSLDPGSYDTLANDDGTNWCEGINDYNNGDLGTPGSDNPMCMDDVVYPIDFCRLQFPEVIDEIEGTNVDVFGRLYIAGLTDLTGVNDPAPEVTGYVGYGPDGSDPAIDPGWVWTVGGPNPAYGPMSPGYEVNNDEYNALLSVPSPPGAYDFAFRFSGDGGMTFTYCDGQGAGSSDGYAPADAGQMTSQPAGPPPPMYFSEYAEGSSSNKALEIYNPPGADADLTACEIRLYFNGNVAPSNTIGLGGVLPADDVLVVCDDSIDPAIFDPMNCDVLAGGSFYNGDDAIELACGATVLDVIGEIGFDPGVEWVNAGVGTQNETIRRDCAVMAGDPNGGDPFDPSIEWTSFAQDDFSDFGQYMCP